MKAINIRGVDEGLWTKLKVEAAKSGKPFREWILWVLEAQLGNEGIRDEVSGGGVSRDTEGSGKVGGTDGLGPAQERKACGNGGAVGGSAKSDRGKRGQGKGKGEEGNGKRLSQAEFLGLSNSEKLRIQREGRAPR